MATKAAPKAAPADASAEKPKKSKLLIIIIALVILLAGGGAGAWFFLGNKKAEKAEHAEKHEEEAKAPVFLPMEPFTVNLQPGENGDQFLQTALTLQLTDEKQVELLKMYMPHVRSRLLLLLSGKKAADILTVEGKNKLAEEIIDIFKKPFVPGGPTINVSSVLFTSFVVQ